MLGSKLHDVTDNLGLWGSPDLPRASHKHAKHATILRCAPETALEYLCCMLPVATGTLLTSELWPKPFEPFVLMCCAIADASRDTDAAKE